MQESFGIQDDRSLSYSSDKQRVVLRVKVSDDDSSWFMLNIILTYEKEGILPNSVSFELEDDRMLSEQDEADFERHCQPFYQLPLLLAFREAF